MMKKLPLIILALTIGFFMVNGAFANATSQNVKHAKDHYHPKGKAPTEHTLKILEAAKADLPFRDINVFVYIQWLNRLKLFSVLLKI